jgi:hypothetical protein
METTIPQNKETRTMRTLFSIIADKSPETPLVCFSQIRHMSNLGKLEFDSEVIQLAVAGRIALHEHDFPHSLTDKARSQLVKCGLEYFVGAEIRRR